MALSELSGSLGIQITLFVIPLLAITEFDATPLQLGTLNLLDSAAALCFGLAIGTVIDRMGGFVAVLVSDLVRFGTVAILAISVVFGPQLVSLYIAMFLVGAASLMREAGTSAAVVELGLRSPASLNRMNALLRGGSVVSETSGPGVAGFLVVALGFSLSLVGGAMGFAIAAVCALAALRLRKAGARSNAKRALVEVGAAPHLNPAPHAETDAADASLAEGKGRGGLGSGLRYIWSHPVLRPLVLSSVQFNFFTAALQAVLLYYCVHVLALSPGEIAIAAVSAGIGGLIGSALAATPMVSRHQKAWYLTSLSVPAVSVAIIVAAQTQPAPAALAMLCVAEFLWSVAIVLCVVLFNTLRQISSPDRLVGQVAASERVLAVGGEVPGALLGGMVGTFLSLDLTMIAALAGIALSPLWAICVRDWSSTATDGVGGRL